MSSIASGGRVYAGHDTSTAVGSDSSGSAPPVEVVRSCSSPISRAWLDDPPGVAPTSRAELIWEAVREPPTVETADGCAQTGVIVELEAEFARERARFHAGLLVSGILAVNAEGVASNADGGSRPSRAYALHIAQALKAEMVGERLAGQTSGGQFEQACADFLEATFTKLGHLRPGDWKIRKVSGRGQASGVAHFEQYAHLVELTAAVAANPSLRAVLGHGYAIAPDVVISRAPVTDEVINARQLLVDGSVSTNASLRSLVQPQPILHAVISCKWTLRSDRAQNARSEALNLIRNRKGRLPHIAVVTGEPMPARISSLALGTGDIDCVYHFALPELVDAVRADGGGDTSELLDMMIEGNRLKDITDLPLDLAV